MGIGLLGGLSFLLYGDFKELVKGLNVFFEDECFGVVNVIFQFYYIMIVIGMILIVFLFYGGWFWWCGKLFDKFWLFWVFVWVVILLQVVNQIGWFVVEMGWQFWVVYGLFRIFDVLFKVVMVNQVFFFLILFFIIYILLLVLFFYMMNKKI